MFWIAWKGYNGGKAVSLGESAQLQAEAYGMHGYPTQQQAQAKPNSVSGFEKIFVNSQLKASNPAQAAQNAAKGAATSIPGVSAAEKGVSGFLSDVSSQGTWIRVGEGALGLILIALGLAKLTGAPNIVSTALKATPQGAAIGKVIK